MRGVISLLLSSSSSWSFHSSLSVSSVLSFACNELAPVPLHPVSSPLPEKQSIIRWVYRERCFTFSTRNSSATTCSGKCFSLSKVSPMSAQTRSCVRLPKLYFKSTKATLNKTFTPEQNKDERSYVGARQYMSPSQKNISQTRSTDDQGRVRQNKHMNQSIIKSGATTFCLF